MKKIIGLMLLLTISLVTLVGCGKPTEDKVITEFLTTLVSTETYENFASNFESDKFIEDSEASFGEYLTDDAFFLLMSNRIPYLYSSVIKENNITKTTDINILKTKKSEAEGYNVFEYEVSYKLTNRDISIDMKDYFMLNIIEDKKFVIDEIYVSNKTSTIFPEYKNISQ